MQDGSLWTDSTVGCKCQKLIVEEALRLAQ